MYLPVQDRSALRKGIKSGLYHILDMQFREDYCFLCQSRSLA